MYRTMGYLHAQGHQLERRAARHLADQRGQGTVEYVALLLLVAGVLTAAVATAKTKDFNIAKTIAEKLQATIETVGAGAGTPKDK